MNEDSTTTPLHSLQVRTQGAMCNITISPGQLASLGATVRAAIPNASKALLVVDANVESSLGPRVCQTLEDAGFSVGICSVTALESEKSLATVESVYAAMLDAGLERTSPVIALGGGITCDMAGFAAATFLRGVPVVMAPTSLLAMVDASIGGKNGVNLRYGEGAIKNMIGTVWQPRAIVTDPETLATLPERHVRCGLAECIKIAMLRDEEILPMVESALAQIQEKKWTEISALIARCASIKASIVEEDEREEDERKGGGRAILNLGHTFAHAFELIESLDLLHGEAVAIGLCAAASVARRTGRIDETHEKRWREIISGVGLPTQLPRSVPVAKLLDLMRRDKKVRLGKLRLVLPTANGGAELVDDMDEHVIGVTLIEIGATA